MLSVVWPTLPNYQLRQLGGLLQSIDQITSFKPLNHLEQSRKLWVRYSKEEYFTDRVGIVC